MLRHMDNDLEQRIAAELRAELSRQRHSKTWLAKQIGRPTSTVARWLRGETSPTLNELDSICMALGMSVADLLAAVERNGGYEPVTTSRPRRGAAETSEGTRTDTGRYAPSALIAA
jgi:transcriptional regulator with XRE-family HTH domain